MSEPSADVLLFSSARPPWLAPAAFEVSENSCPPLGLLYVAAALEKKGLRVGVHDFYRFGQRPRDVQPLVAAARPRLVGVSALTSGFNAAARMCRYVKETDPDIVTVLGGPHATAAPMEVLEDPHIDVVVSGEGEAVFPALVQEALRGELSAARLGSLEGLAYRQDGQVVIRPQRVALDPDSLPVPARHLVPLDQYLQAGAVVASRGCPHGCFFCSSVSFNSHTYRFRRPTAVVEEMDLISSQWGIHDFEFLDDALTADPERLTELCGLLQDRGYRWGCQGTIRDLVDRSSGLQEMADAGCGGIFFGIESGHPDVLRRVKGLQLEAVTAVVEAASGVGMRVITSFMVGHPWDTHETIAATMALMERFQDLGCHTPVSILVPFPGSQVAEHPERFEITVESKDYTRYFHNQAVISTKHLSRDELEDIYFEILCRLTDRASTDESPTAVEP